MLTEPTFMFNKTVIIFPYLNDRISFQNDNLVVSDDKGTIKFQYSCYKIFLIFIVGGTTITSGIIEKSKKFGFSIVLLSTTFKIVETINFKTEGNTLLRMKQYFNVNSLLIARKIIENKILNQMEFIKKIRQPDENTKRSLMDCIHNVKTADDIHIIMGYEGIASKVYFNRIFKDFEWKGRQPRVKRDTLNLLLDIGYTILFNYIEALLNLYGFDVYKGSLHQEFFNRKSLVCDMIEPFRPIIDYSIRKMITLKQISNNDFIKLKDGRYQLKWEQNSKVVGVFLQEINDYRQEMFKYFQQYYRWFVKELCIDKMPMANLIKINKV
jgi:CRISPR-associated protein Cas1